MKLRRLAATLTFTGLAGAVALSLAWALMADGAGQLEASAQTLGLVAALTGIVADRLAAERQRRRLALLALAEELRKNRAIIGDLRFTLGKTTRRRVYPRLLLSAADGVISSGVLAASGEHELFSKLHAWRDEVADFNRRLDLTEMLTFLQGTPEEMCAFERALGRDGGRLHRVGQQLDELLDRLAGGSDGESPSWSQTGHEQTGPRGAGRMVVLRSARNAGEEAATRAPVEHGRTASR